MRGPQNGINGIMRREEDYTLCYVRAQKVAVSQKEGSPQVQHRPAP